MANGFFVMKGRKRGAMGEELGEESGARSSWTRDKDDHNRGWWIKYQGGEPNGRRLPLNCKLEWSVADTAGLAGCRR